MKIYLAAGAAVLVTAFLGGGAIWSNHRIARAERAVTDAKAAADEKERLAAEKETEAAAFKEKTEYMEKKIADIGEIARKQDEELEKLKTDTVDARGRVERARSIRSIGATTDELCQKLADVGHPCQ